MKKQKHTLRLEVDAVKETKEAARSSVPIKPERVEKDPRRQKRYNTVPRSEWPAGHSK